MQGRYTQSSRKSLLLSPGMHLDPMMLNDCVKGKVVNIVQSLGGLQSYQVRKSKHCETIEGT